MKMTINLKDKLISEKKLSVHHMIEDEQSQQRLLENVQNILAMDKETDLIKLRQSGFNTAVDEAFKLNSNLDKKREKRSNLNNSRIFRKKEIQEIALRYNLKFLPTKYYKGTIPDDLPQKIKAAEEICKDTLCITKTSDWLIEGSKNWEYSPEYHILAPKGSFNLKEKPKDPLLFLKLKDGTYYLVHKWGDDLSIWRDEKLMLMLCIMIPFLLCVNTPFFISAWWLLLVVPFSIGASIITFVSIIVDPVSPIDWDKPEK